MAAATIDYDKLAAQHGGTAAMDYDALAAQHGGAVASQSAPDTRNFIQKGVDALTTVTPEQEKGHSWLTNKVQEFGAGAIQGLAAPIVHPIETAKGVARFAANPTYEGYAMAANAAEHPAQAAGNLAGGVILGEATAPVVDALKRGVNVLSKSSALLPGQNYAPNHAASFEGAIAPATAMGKNFIPQNITSEALTPIRATAAKMAQGTPIEQGIVQAATSSKTPPLERIGAYQNIVQNALNDLESQHAPALAQNAKVSVDTTPIVRQLQSQISPTMAPADVSAIRQLMQRVRQAQTIGDLNKFRQELNIETSPEYRQSQVQAGRSGISAQTASDLAGWVRNAYYDALQKVTGTDFAPLKRQEANLITTQEALQNQQAPLAKAEATYNAPSTLRETAGNIANVIKDPKTTVTQTILRESPATKVATLLKKSLDDLPDHTPPPAPPPPAPLSRGLPTPSPMGLPASPLKRLGTGLNTPQQ